MRFILRLLVLCQCLLILIGCSTTSYTEPQAGFVTGVVSEQATGNPIDSAAVVVPLPHNLADTVYSDKNGNYLLRFGMIYGTRTILASKPGFSESQKQVKVIPGDTVTLDFELEKTN